MADMEIFIKTWDLYFIEDDFTIFNKDVSQIIEIRKMINISEDDVAKIARAGIYKCNYLLYLKMGKPSEIKCISCAVSELIYEKTNERMVVRTKIYGKEIEKEFSSINTKNVGSLVGVLGTVCRVGYRRIENVRGVFECVKCTRIIKTNMVNNVYKPPTCPCKGRTQVFLEDHNGNKCIDAQEIRIQEMIGEGVNRDYVDVDLYEDLVGIVSPGDVVEVTGIILAEKVEDAYKLKLNANNIKIINNNDLRYKMIDESVSSEGSINNNSYNNNNIENYNNIENHNNNSYNNCPVITCSPTQIVMSLHPNDFDLFKKLSEEPFLMKLLTTTFYSSIVGHELVKQALVLALFGGTNKFTGNDSIRSEIHILIIGDPGLGKSRILLASSMILPKSTYISGNFCTTSGLTVSLIHDPSSGEYMADAGALIISDGGVCCIDEFDKIDDHAALFEIMEDQMVTVAKGGVVCSVASRPTIIAAANPRYGHFDSSKSIRQNLKFDSALLSRFDLIFILIDNLGEKEDYSIFQKLIKGEDKSAESKYARKTLVRYVEYARKTVNPILSRGANSKIKEYYLSIRKLRHVNIRNLEALKRITEAYARMELKNIACEKHAVMAIKIYDKILIKEEEKKRCKVRIEDNLKEYVSIKGIFIERENLIELIKETEINKNIEEYIEILNCKGIIIKLAKNKYKICIR